MRSVSLSRIAALLSIAGALWITLAASSQAVVPAGFTDQQVAVLTQPVSLAFTPDGRMLITTKLGFVRVYEDGALKPQPALDLSAQICTDTERGLIGIAVDPAFESNHYIYLYYSFKKYGVCDVNTPNSPVTRVSRYVLGDNDLIDPATGTVLIDNVPNPGAGHIAGDLQFGKDGYLYASIGDGVCDFRGDSGCFGLNDVSRDLGALSGKILRVTRNGNIPSGNPFTGSDSDRCAATGSTTVTRKCREIYAWGLRNPFRLGFDSNAAQTRFFINDVGQGAWEEIDVGGTLDYGWNVREGPCAIASLTNCGPPPPGMTNPIHAYDHSANCRSITLGAFVPTGAWSPEYDGLYVFGDYVCGKIWTLEDHGGTYVATEFASNLGGVISGTFGPNGSGQALYYIAWPPAQFAVRRIVFTGGANRPPEAQASADPTNGDLPLAVDFDGSQSSDPDDDPLTYEWDFGDGSPAASGAQVSHTYSSPGTNTATLTVRDGRGGEDQSTIRIDAGNNAPNVQIDQPSASKLFRVGETITLSGSANDPEDGALPDEALTWTVERHHNIHTHPYLPPTEGNDIPIVAPEPEDIESATNSFLEVYLSATDSAGLSSTVYRAVYPQTVELTFETQPSGLGLEFAGGAPVTTPLTVTSWEAWRLPVHARNQPAATGGSWVFQSWSDGGTAFHEIVTPAQPATYSAQFAYRYPRPGGGTPLRVALVPSYQECLNPSAEHVGPIASGSCPNATLESSLLTIGKLGQGSARATLLVQNGNMGTPEDEADVSLIVSAWDVRVAGSGSDYVGNVLLRVSLRMTDYANGTFGDEAATVSDMNISVPFACAATPEPAGGMCALNTTLDTLVPGFATEGKRAVISAPSVAVLDLGPDGSMAPASGTCPPVCGSGDEQPFLGQGLFAP